MRNAGRHTHEHGPVPALRDRSFVTEEADAANLGGLSTVATTGRVAISDCAHLIWPHWAAGAEAIPHDAPASNRIGELQYPKSNQ